MKKYSFIVHSVLIVLLMLFTAYLLFKVSALEDLLFSGVFTSMNPEKRVPNNPDNSDMSVIFTFIGVIFALFSFLTFQGVKDFYESKIREVKKKQKKAKKDAIAQYESQVHNLKMLENDISYMFYNTLNDYALKYKENGNLSQYVSHGITACEHLSKMLENPIGENADFIKTSKEILSNLLHEIKAEIKKSGDGVLIENLSLERLKIKQERINKVIFYSDYKTVNYIFSQIKLEENSNP